MDGRTGIGVQGQTGVTFRQGQSPAPRCGAIASAVFYLPSFTSPLLRRDQPRCEFALGAISLDNLIGSPKGSSLLRYRRSL
jgi:hypothetical protein